MNNDFLKGIKIGFGFIFIIGFLSLVSAVGFHVAEEIMPGTFNGDYKFNGAVQFQHPPYPSNRTLIYIASNKEGVPTGDGFRLRYMPDFFAPKADAIVFEKTDGNTADPDNGGSGFAFVNTGNDGIVETSMVIKGNGNVGIGTKNPKGKLHLSSDNWQLLLEETDASIGKRRSIIQRDGEFFTIWNDNEDTTYTLQLSATYDGNISIGNKLSTKELCDETGNNCKDISSGWGSGGSVPAGAVMAFNLATCPTGWSELTSARGRTIVGLNPSDSSFTPLGKIGGAKTHTLTIAQIPSHSGHVGTLQYFRSGPSGPQLNAGKNSASHGGGQAHNNLQPYISLLYCQKD